MKRHVPNKRKNFISLIRAMQPGQYMYFAGANSSSLKVIASQVGINSKPKRRYTTQKEASGVSCWRET